MLTDHQRTPLTLAAAIDDYLHTIVRSRPWTIKRDQEILEALDTWLSGPDDDSPPIAQIDPAIVERYVRDAGIDQPQRAELHAALDALFTWLVHDRAVSDNPFAA